MPTIEEGSRTLCRAFRKRLIRDLGELFQILGTRSHMTVFRRLREVGYRTSFTHRGRFYTLEDIPQFDVHGLWFYEGVGFSRDGTLKETLLRLVPGRDGGFLHHELESLLRIPVHNTLLALVREGRLGREMFEGVYLYGSPEPSRAAQQRAQRKEIARRARPLSLPLVVEVLLEVIRDARLGVEPRKVAARLSARGFPVTVEQVQLVCDRYDLGAEKKTARSPSPRSPR